MPERVPWICVALASISPSKCPAGPPHQPRQPRVRRSDSVGCEEALIATQETLQFCALLSRLVQVGPDGLSASLHLRPEENGVSPE